MKETNQIISGFEYSHLSLSSQGIEVGGYIKPQDCNVAIDLATSPDTVVRYRHEIVNGVQIIRIQDIQ